MTFLGWIDPSYKDGVIQTKECFLVVLRDATFLKVDCTSSSKAPGEAGGSPRCRCRPKPTRSPQTALLNTWAMLEETYSTHIITPKSVIAGGRAALETCRGRKTVTMGCLCAYVRAKQPGAAHARLLGSFERFEARATDIKPTLATFVAYGTTGLGSARDYFGPTALGYERR